jgi:hypothetical protein
MTAAVFLVEGEFLGKLSEARCTVVQQLGNEKEV